MTSFQRAAGSPPAVDMTWYEGGLMPPTPADMPAGKRLPDNGVLYVGSKGKMFHGSHGGMPEVLPVSLAEAAKSSQDVCALARPLRRMAAGLQRGSTTSLEFRLRGAADGNCIGGRALAAGSRQTAGMG